MINVGISWKSVDEKNLGASIFLPVEANRVIVAGVCGAQEANELDGIRSTTNNIVSEKRRLHNDEGTDM